MTDIIPPDLAAWMDQEDAHIADQIRRYGVSIQMIGGGRCSVPGCCAPVSDCPFAYTVGLFGIGHPELIVTGLDIPGSSRTLNAATDFVYDGGRFMPGVETAVPGWGRVLPEAVPNPGDIVFNANCHYRRPAEFSVPALQLAYPDKRGRFPSDPSFSGARKRQPRPGEWDALT
ncbi:MAG: hypothetical protein ABS62_01965 [Microbacterium sp. SCN 70-200]|uniref:DUF4262 domain-containing protein n=1 Tax=unclassified Microbacterium TaxID=2609290 RepID=UPI00086A1A98|nr:MULTISPECIES: DUF4262 domain-containing protein [unclassified Microbacterium]MBN9215258.1 DUF4262 domain-containing protein [Microbacterium sp.]ODT42666.1 MAG: hypothetical protein ABS62_01965 [Microbacterium sp. SCN 70-200]OJV79991.1 MAG: hypothetical protein BGO46_07065 [Microbacterium sp. 70-16]